MSRDLLTRLDTYLRQRWARGATRQETDLLEEVREAVVNLQLTEEHLRAVEGEVSGCISRWRDIDHPMLLDAARELETRTTLKVEPDTLAHRLLWLLNNLEGRKGRYEESLELACMPDIHPTDAMSALQALARRGLVHQGVVADGRVFYSLALSGSRALQRLGPFPAPSSSGGGE